MRARQRCFTLALLGFVLAFLALGAFHYAYDWPILRFPVLVGAVTCLLGLAVLVQSRGPAPAGSDTADGSRAPATSSPRLTLAAMGWVAAAVPVVFVLGFVVGLPLYLFVYLKTHGRGWLRAAAIALCALAVIYLFFVRLSGMPAGLFPAQSL